MITNPLLSKELLYALKALSLAFLFGITVVSGAIHFKEDSVFHSVIYFAVSAIYICVMIHIVGRY